MECADDIAYGVHDLEDIVARHLVNKRDVLDTLDSKVFLADLRVSVHRMIQINLSDFENLLFSESSSERKRFIGRLVNLFITSAEIRPDEQFHHPLCDIGFPMPDEVGTLLGVPEGHDISTGRGAS